MTTRCGVYKIKCISSGRFYIGSSVNVDKRLLSHLRSLRKNKHHNLFLQRTYNKYGEDDFKIQVIELKSESLARKREQYMLYKYEDSGLLLNIGKSATGGDNLTRNPRRKVIVAKITKSINALISDMTELERRDRFSRPGELNGMFGRTHTKRARHRISESAIGNTRALGSIRSEEQKETLSTYAKLRTGEKNPFYGKTHTEEIRKRLSEKAIERVASGILPSNTRPVKVGKKKYRSATCAAKALGCTSSTVLNRVRSDKFPEYKFVD